MLRERAGERSTIAWRRAPLPTVRENWHGGGAGQPQRGPEGEATAHEWRGLGVEFERGRQASARGRHLNACKMSDAKGVNKLIMQSAPGSDHVFFKRCLPPANDPPPPQEESNHYFTHSPPTTKKTFFCLVRQPHVWTVWTHWDNPPGKSSNQCVAFSTRIQFFSLLNC